MSALTVGIGYAAGAVTMLLLRKRRKPIRVNEDGHWEFPIDTLPQMIAIPVERRERFLAEIVPMFRRMWELTDKYPLRTIGTTWVDDELAEFRPVIPNAPENVGDAFAERPLA